MPPALLESHFISLRCTSAFIVLARPLSLYVRVLSPLFYFRLQTQYPTEPEGQLINCHPCWQPDDMGSHLYEREATGKDMGALLFVTQKDESGLNVRSGHMPGSRQVNLLT